MKQKLKQSRGITLVSLVVTVIILIILAGVSINLILGENGLIEKAKETKPIVDIATAQEKLELVKGPVQLSKYRVNLDDYLEELDKVKEKYEVDYVEKINEINAEIIIGGKYKFLATDEENGNVKIVYQGEAGKLKINPTTGTIKYPETTTFEVIENESGGELSVKAENENIAKASINGTIVTVMSQNMAGTTKIIVTSAANGKYAQGKVTYTAIVENGEITLTADAYTGNYDGQDHDAVSNVVVTPSDAKLEYSIDEGTTFSTTIPKVNGATTYSVIIKATKAGYATKTITKTITVGKNTETGNLVISPTSGTITYPKTGTFSVTKNASGGTLSVTSSNTNVATASIDTTGKVTITPKAITTDNQKVTITVKSAATSNYTEQTKTYTATIKQGTMTLTADAYTGDYDGQDHDAVSNVVVTPSDAKLEYSIDEGTTFSTTIPKVNGVTTYSVIIKASKAGYATKTITKTITIKDTTPPTKTIINLNGYTSGSWTNANVTITASSTDLSGIDYYQYSHDGVNPVATMPNPWTISWDGSWNFYVRAIDKYGNIGEWSDKFIINRDAELPSKPTVTYNSGNGEHKWQNNINITLTSTDNTAISYYEVDWDGDGVADTRTNSNFVPWNGYSSCNTRFRAVDTIGNCSEWSEAVHIHMDTEAPGVTTITYNSGSNECKWQNNINITLTSSDNVSILHYELDWNGDGVADSRTASNFIPENGYNSCTNRFRAVDIAGNKGPWTNAIHVHTDTQAPTLTNWWHGGYDGSKFSLYVQLNENVALASVQGPTSTGTGNYQNWNWINAVWDNSANAYRIDIYPSTYGHYNTPYMTHLYVYDTAGNGGYINQTSINVNATYHTHTSSCYTKQEVECGCTSTSAQYSKHEYSPCEHGSSCPGWWWCTKCDHLDHRGNGRCTTEISKNVLKCTKTIEGYTISY